MVRTLHTRGCQPRGLVRETRMPTGKATLNARIVNGPKRANPIVTAGGIEISGMMDRRMMTIRTHCSRDRREFTRHCERNGIRVIYPHKVALDGTWGYTTVVEVVAPEATLEKLCEQYFVEDCSAPLDVRAPRLTASTFRRDPF